MKDISDNQNLKQKLDIFLKKNFPESDLDSALGEIWTENSCLIWTGIEAGKNSDNKLFNANKLAVELFESLFPQLDDNIWILINKWDLYSDDFVTDRLGFLDSSNHISWESLDKTHQVTREQIFCSKPLKEIDYKGILSGITDYERTGAPDINGRIFFLCKKSRSYYIYWDSCIEIGSNDLTLLANYYRKYYHKMSSTSIEKIEKILSSGGSSKSSLKSSSN